MDRVQIFPQAVFLGVAMEWPLDDKDVWFVELEYRLKRAIAFDPTVGSRSKFYRGFQRLFSLGQRWNGYSVTRMSGKPNLRSGLKGPKLLIRQRFLEVVFIGVAKKWLIGEEDVWRLNLSIGSKGHNF